MLLKKLVLIVTIFLASTTLFSSNSNEFQKGSILIIPVAFGNVNETPLPFLFESLGLKEQFNTRNECEDSNYKLLNSSAYNYADIMLPKSIQRIKHHKDESEDLKNKLLELSSPDYFIEFFIYLPTIVLYDTGLDLLKNYALMFEKLTRNKEIKNYKLNFIVQTLNIQREKSDFENFKTGCIEWAEKNNLTWDDSNFILVTKNNKEEGSFTSLYLKRLNLKNIVSWSSNLHPYMPSQAKEIIETLLLSLKVNQKKTGIKIPKFVVFEIIKRIDWQSIHQTNNNKNSSSCILW